MDAPSAAQTTHIGFLFKGYVWFLIVPIGLALAWLIMRLYRRETDLYGKAGARLRMIRGAVVFLLILLLSQPVIHRVIATYQPPVVIVLRDSSTSMSVIDAHEPLERQVRMAVALGMLDPKLRDTQVQQAAQALSAAQTSTETAAASVRQAVQSLQDHSAEAGEARERIKDACAALTAAAKEARRAVTELRKAPNVPPEMAVNAEKHAQTADRLSSELSEVVPQGGAGQARAADKAVSVKILVQELARLTTEANAVQDKVDRALGQRGDAEIKEALKKLVTLNRGQIVQKMLNEKVREKIGSGVKVVNYFVDTELRDARRDEKGDDKNAKPEDKDKRVIDAADTDLATPLLRLDELHAQDSIAAIVLVSDGRHTTGPSPEDAARVIAARGITLHTIGVGSQDAPPDLCVARLDGTLSVFLQETIRLTAHIKVAGFKHRSFKLLLQRDGQTLQQRVITVKADGWVHENFEIPADKAGANVFVALIKPVESEALTTNNSAEAVVDVSNDRLKVLLIDEKPRWETRYIASLLRRERNMTLDERWLLSGENMGLRAQALPDNQQALDEYEVIVMGDISRERLDEAAQKRLSSYVADRGGFLVLVAGPDAMPQSFLTGPLSDLIPIRQHSSSTVAAMTSADAPAQVRVKMDPSAVNNEIVRILRDPKLNDELWPALPELNWVARPAYAKPGAQVLLHTDDARKDVITAVQNFGAGRVLYFGTDSSWRWRYKVADRVHAYFWSQAIRWGTSNRLIGGPRLKAGAVRRQIRPGDNLEVLARPRDTAGKAVSDATVVAEMEDNGARQRIQLQMVPDSGGLYRGYFQKVSAGVHTIKVGVESPGFDGVSQELQVISREVTGQEGIDLTRDTARLTALAQVGGGRAVDLQDAPELFSQLAGQKRRHDVESTYELWSSYPALMLIVLLLSLEWILRKRMGLA